MTQKIFKAYFFILGFYDFLLGLAFLLFYPAIYGYFKITLPNHPGYIQVPALFLMSAAIGNFLIANNLLKNTDLVIVRILMKLSFAFVIFYSYFTTSIPKIYLPIASLSAIGVVICLIFLNWASKETRGITK